MFNVGQRGHGGEEVEKKKESENEDNNKTGPAAAARKGGEGQYNKNLLRQQQQAKDQREGRAMGAMGGVGRLWLAHTLDSTRLTRDGTDE